MRHAPSVNYPVGRSLLAAAWAAAAWLAGACTVAAWWLHGAGPAWHAWLGAALLATTAAWAGWCWLRNFEGELRWDGSAWHLSGRGAALPDLSCALDLQVALLLRVSGDPARWLWVERRRAPARWHALRCAVYSRARPDALDGATPPPAKP